MARNKIFPTAESLTEWLSSTGFLFPRNAVELSRFDKLHGKVLSEDEDASTVSCERILSGGAKPFPVENHVMDEEEVKMLSQYKMAARKGLDGLPEDILRKMMDNQKNSDPL